MKAYKDFLKDLAELKEWSVSFEEQNDNGTIDYFISISNATIQFFSPMYPDVSNQYPHEVQIFMYGLSKETSMSLYEYNIISGILSNYNLIIKSWLRNYKDKE